MTEATNELMTKPTLDEEVSEIVKSVYFGLKEGKSVEDFSEYGHLAQDVLDIQKAFDDYMENKERYNFVIHDGNISVTHFIAFVLVGNAFIYQTSHMVNKDAMREAIKNHFLNACKRVGITEDESVAAAFDSTYTDVFLAVYCYVIGLRAIGEAPY